MPLAPTKLKIMHYTPIMDRITSLIHGWINKTLFCTARVKPIQSALQGMKCL